MLFCHCSILSLCREGSSTSLNLGSWGREGSINPVFLSHNPSSQLCLFCFQWPIRSAALSCPQDGNSKKSWAWPRVALLAEIGTLKPQLLSPVQNNPLCNRGLRVEITLYLASGGGAFPFIKEHIKWEETLLKWPLSFDIQSFPKGNRGLKSRLILFYLKERKEKKMAVRPWLNWRWFFLLKVPWQWKFAGKIL